MALLEIIVPLRGGGKHQLEWIREKQNSFQEDSTFDSKASFVFVLFYGPILSLDPSFS